MLSRVILESSPVSSTFSEFIFTEERYMYPCAMRLILGVIGIKWMFSVTRLRSKLNQPALK